MPYSKEHRYGSAVVDPGFLGGSQLLKGHGVGNLVTFGHFPDHDPNCMGPNEKVMDFGDPALVVSWPLIYAMLRVGKSDSW